MGIIAFVAIVVLAIFMIIYSGNDSDDRGDGFNNNSTGYDLWA